MNTFKSILTSLLGLGIMALLLLCWTPQARAKAVWDVHLTNFYGSDPFFKLDGQFTTADANVPRGTGEPTLSFTGTVTDVYETDAELRFITPGMDVIAGPGLVFTYNDIFYGPTDLAHGWSTGDAFNSDGVVVATAGSNINIFSSGIPIAYVYSPSHGDYAITIEFLQGDITLAVPETQTWMLLVVGLGIVCRRGRAS